MTSCGSRCGGVLCVLALALPACAAEQPLDPVRSRLGINLNGPADWNSELPFVDAFRLSRRWIGQRRGEGWGKGPELQRHEHGWVTRLEPDCWAETPMCTIDGGRFPQGRYTCLYEGKGTIELWNIGPVVTEEPGRIVFETKPGAGTIWLRLRTVDPDDYLRNIRVIMPGFESTYRDEPFHPAFLDRWRGFNTLRFMDWMKTNGSPISTWDERPTMEDCNWTERGIPLEVMLDLSNRLHANPWFCMPHRATDDYVRHFAAQVEAGLDPGLKVYIEYSNEIWNSIFEQTRYCNDEGTKLGLGDKPWEAGWRFCGLRSVQIFAIWEEVFGGTDRLVRVIAGQSANPYIAGQKLGFQDAWQHCDAVAIAPYFALLVPPKTEGDRLGADTMASWTVDQILDRAEQQALPRAIEGMKGHQQLADQYKLRLVCYEAGQHLVGVGGGENNDQLTKLFMEANRHPRMGALYTTHLDAWLQVSGDLCCIFSSVGRWSKWGSWGLAEYYDETPADQPKLKAVLDWNRAHPVE